MIIRKLFKFEGAHVVRNCYSDRCKYSIHGHSYVVEIFLSSISLDKAHMVLDFGVLKNQIKEFIDSFDHSWAFWTLESEDFKKFVKENSLRWVELPVNVSAEALSILFYAIIDEILDNTEFNNGEDEIHLTAVRVHETDTGYAEASSDDLYVLNKLIMKSCQCGIESSAAEKAINHIIFSEGVKKEWKDYFMWDKIKSKVKFIYNKPEQQIL